jgi:hypothetical protein
MKGKDYICPDCGKPCRAVQCDAGIGPYEYWGVKGFDSRPYTGSDCCEAELTEDNYQPAAGAALADGEPSEGEH